MRFVVPERLGHVVEDDEGPVLYLCPLPCGPATAIVGSGAVIWIYAAGGDEDIVASVAEEFDVAPESIRPDVEKYLQYLLDAGFLERST